MDNKRNRLKRGLVLVLTLALVGNGMSHTMLSALAKENEPEVTDVQEDLNGPVADQPEAEGEPEDADAGQSKTEAEVTSGNTKENEEDKEEPGTENKAGEDKEAEDPGKASEQEEVKVIGDILDLGGTETSAETISLFSLAADGTVALTAGNHEKWIDRIDIPAYAKTLYNTMAEGVDNDGVKDIFIDDQYYSEANAQKIDENKYNVIPITNMTGDQASVNKEFQEIGKYVRAVYDAFDRDFPEVFWLTGENRIIYTGSGRVDASGNVIYECQVYFILKGYTQKFDVRRAEYQSASAVKGDIAERNKMVQEISGGASAGSVFDKVTYFNEWLTTHNEYNTNVAAATYSYKDAWECMSALNGRIGTQGPVCEGYARAFKVLCDKAGIPCVLVDGTATSDGTNGEAHMWNYVKVDGSWYAMDVTWNDPVGGKDGALSGVESTAWSLLGADSMVMNMRFEASHPVTNKASVGGTKFINGPVLSKEGYVKKPVPEISFDSAEINAVYNGKEVVVNKPVVTVTDDKGNTSTITDADITYSYKASDSDEFKAGIPVNAGKYTLKASMAATDAYAAAEAEISVNVAKVPVTIKAVDQSITYGESVVTGVNGISSTALVEGEAVSEISLTAEGKNAGTYTITPSAAVIRRGDAEVTGNYEITYENGTLTIVKAEYSGEKSASQSTRYSNKDTYDLASLLPDGAKLGAMTVVDDSSIFEGEPSISGTVLSYKLTADSAKVGQTATITVPVTETTNYNPFVITFTVTVSAKLAQDGFKFDVSEVKKAYGDGDFAVTASNAAEGSTVTYKSSDPTVATVDENGNVHILRLGNTTITATASETEDYVSKSITYTLTVSPRALTWDVSGLHAVDKQGMVDKDTKKASLYGELRVSGILPADNGKVNFICPAEGENAKLIGTYADTKPGSKKVTLKWAGEAVVLTGTDVENYTLPDKLPEITGRINAVTEQTNVPESTDTVKYKLEIEGGISQVPAALADNEELNTPVKIEEKMKAEIRVKLAEESNKNSVEVYDVTLMVKDGENDWVVATEENFPKDGITVTLPYPEGTAKDTHNFEIAHMFTHTWNGRTAGEIEYPKASKIDSGVQFKVTSLSPLAIGWKEIKADKPGTNGTTNNTNSTTPNKSRSPQTGDENAVMLYVLLMVLGAAGVGFTMKRRALR